MAIIPSTLKRSISPPPVSEGQRRAKVRRAKSQDGTKPNNNETKVLPSLATIEAGQTKICDHLSYFAEHFSQLLRPSTSALPRLSTPDFVELYERNQHARGRHFVVHQHNHPVAGVHCI
jgi:hypothetical protein